MNKVVSASRRWAPSHGVGRRSRRHRQVARSSAEYEDRHHDRHRERWHGRRRVSCRPLAVTADVEVDAEQGHPPDELRRILCPPRTRPSAHLADRRKPRDKLRVTATSSSRPPPPRRCCTERCGARRELRPAGGGALGASYAARALHLDMLAVVPQEELRHQPTGRWADLVSRAPRGLDASPRAMQSGEAHHRHARASAPPGGAACSPFPRAVASDAEVRLGVASALDNPLYRQVDDDDEVEQNICSRIKMRWTRAQARSRFPVTGLNSAPIIQVGSAIELADEPTRRTRRSVDQMAKSFTLAERGSRQHRRGRPAPGVRSPMTGGDLFASATCDGKRCSFAGAGRSRPPARHTRRDAWRQPSRP